jgi:hypothetical protein
MAIDPKKMNPLAKPKKPAPTKKPVTVIVKNKVTDNKRA